MTMLRNGPTLEAMTTTRPPAPPQWAPGFVPSTRQASSRRLALAMAGVGLLAIAALVVGIIALAQTPASSVNASAQQDAPVTAEHTFSAPDQAAAKAKVCATFEQTAGAVRVATSAPDGAEPIAASVNARAALTASALALSRSVSAATPQEVAVAANSLVDAYSGYLLTAFQEKTQGAAERDSVEKASVALRAQCE